ncbi:MAG: phosphoribosylamine--glycine ligase [Epulopiscium sp.]|nr:phosphoribosylamine--glycine ligase [Candidatus Epulonipiscium sp.]
MKVLVVGGGGREHALVWKIVQSNKVTKIYCAPGNGGIEDIAECVDIKPTDIEDLVAFAKEKEIDLTVVGMDDPLVMGIVDEFQKEGLRIFGPSKRAAEIEGSKVFAKELMKKYNIPTAAYEVFTDPEEAIHYVKKQPLPIVIKADGLALGKGVLICQTHEEAVQGIYDMMIHQKFKEAGKRIVVEEYMEGPEVSVLTFCDGKTVIPMVSVQDHKRALDGDQGPNTGGMGTFSPSPHYTKEIEDYCMEYIFQPTLDAMSKEGRPFTGILFFGLMLTKQGIKVLEYNARFGDPETQVVLPRLENDIINIFEACLDQRLDELRIKWSDQAAVCIVMASGGYPVKYQTGYPIEGLDALKEDSNWMVFHAGTKKEKQKVLTDGGRVLGVTGLGNNLQQAIKKAYEGVSQIQFKNQQYRKDIGRKKSI